MVTWSTSIPRSASSSSMLRYDRPNRRYQRTVSTITSGGKQKPANADRSLGAGQGWRVLMAAVCSGRLHRRCNSAVVVGSERDRGPGGPSILAAEQSQGHLLIIATGCLLWRARSSTHTTDFWHHRF